MGYLIEIKLKNRTERYNLDWTLDKEYDFPSCDFWNVNDSYWDTDGCFVYNISNDTVICGCTHLTTFSISDDNIVPEANILTELDWRKLTWSNLMKFPTVWITCLVSFILFIIICWIKPRSSISTKSIMAFEDIIYKSVQEEKLW